MPAISIEEALKQFDKRYSRLILPENIVESFLVNTRRYVEKVNNAIATITVDYDAVNYDFKDIEVVAKNYEVISSEDMESYLNRKKGNDKNEEQK